MLNENTKLKKSVENKVLTKFKRDLFEKGHEIERVMKELENKCNEIVIKGNKELKAREYEKV